MGVGIVMLTDAGAGVFVTHITGKIFGYELPFYFYLIGILLALLPDFNVLLIRMAGKEIHHHRTIDHYPVIVVPIFFALGFFSIFWATVVSLCFLAHFIHDSLDRERGPGIQWLAPLGKKNYRFFGKKDGKRKLILSYTKKETEKMLSLIPPVEECIEELWLKPTLESVSGIIIFFGAIIFSIIW